MRSYFVLYLVQMLKRMEKETKRIQRENKNEDRKFEYKKKWNLSFMKKKETTATTTTTTFVIKQRIKHEKHEYFVAKCFNSNCPQTYEWQLKRKERWIGRHSLEWLRQRINYKYTFWMNQCQMLSFYVHIFVCKEREPKREKKNWNIMPIKCFQVPRGKKNEMIIKAF